MSPIGGDPGSQPKEERDKRRDLRRDLGVVEAITAVTRSCPNGGVVLAAERALEAIKQGGADAMRQHAYFVLVAIRGWRGDRAEQVHRSLTRYLESAAETGPKAARRPNDDTPDGSDSRTS